MKAIIWISIGYLWVLCFHFDEEQKLGLLLAAQESIKNMINAIWNLSVVHLKFQQFYSFKFSGKNGGLVFKNLLLEWKILWGKNTFWIFHKGSFLPRHFLFSTRQRGSRLFDYWDLMCWYLITLFYLIFGYTTTVDPQNNLIIPILTRISNYTPKLQ